MNIFFGEELININFIKSQLYGKVCQESSLYFYQ